MDKLDHTEYSITINNSDATFAVDRNGLKVTLSIHLAYREISVYASYITSSPANADLGKRESYIQHANRGTRDVKPRTMLDAIDVALDMLKASTIGADALPLCVACDRLCAVARLSLDDLYYSWYAKVFIKEDKRLHARLDALYHDLSNKPATSNIKTDGT